MTLVFLKYIEGLYVLPTAGLSLKWSCPGATNKTKEERERKAAGGRDFSAFLFPRQEVSVEKKKEIQTFECK